MSVALVKKSLELFEDDLKADGPTKKKKTKLAEDPMLQISTNRKGVRRELKKLKSKQGKNKQGGAKQAWSALETYDYKKSVDCTEASVKALQRISQTNRKDHKTADVVFTHHHQGKKGRMKKEAQKKDSTDEGTVFTEEDFKNFEKEFFSR